MAKSSRGGMTVYEKQDMVISQFERINRNEQYRREPTWLEKQIEESRIKNEEFKTRQAKIAPQPYISFYNPDNILNRTRHLSPEDRKAAIKQFNNEQKAAAKLAAQDNA
jgi:hypothetical protein